MYESEFNVWYPQSTRISVFPIFTIYESHDPTLVEASVLYVRSVSFPLLILSISKKKMFTSLPDASFVKKSKEEAFSVSLIILF